ncbi:MAG: hypothetical protein J1F31_04935 [Erysipelotrichales bacterium]|nr:hypothetical protein [Erysipelotrichales bacterium]
MNKKYFENAAKTADDLELENEFIDQIKNDKDYVDDILRPLKVSHDLFIDYLYIFVDAQKEYNNCKNCKGLKNCPNKVKGMRVFPVKSAKYIDKNYAMCSLYIEKRAISSHYIYCDFSEKYSDLSLKDMKHFKNGNRQQLKIALKEKIKDKNKDWLFVYGSQDSSKTEFLVSYANDYAKNKLGGIAFINIKDTLEYVKDHYYKSSEEVHDYLESLSDVDLLILDGFDKDIIINNILRDQFLLPLIKYRFEQNKETLIGSRINLDELTKVLAINKFGLENALEITKTIHKKLYKKAYYLEHLIL